MGLKLILAFLIAPLGALAEDMPQRPTSGIADLAALLSADEESRLQSLIGEIRSDTGVELIVVTMDRMTDRGGRGQSLETYVTALFNSWGIGDADRDDGIMLLVASGDRATRIELGDGFSKAYDARAQWVIDAVMLPKFREGRMAMGILEGVAGIRDQIAKPFAAGSWVGLADLVPTILIWLGLGGAAYGVTRIGRSIWRAYVRCPSCGKSGITRHSEVIDHATSLSSGRGVTHLSCSLCGFTEDRAYTIAAVSSHSNDSSSSSGGSSGGGSSSGGGASGHW